MRPQTGHSIKNFLAIKIPHFLIFKFDKAYSSAIESISFFVLPVLFAISSNFEVKSLERRNEITEESGLYFFEVTSNHAFSISIIVTHL